MAVSPNISSIAEPGKARLPSAPPTKRVLTSPKPRCSRRDKRECRATCGVIYYPRMERSGYALLGVVQRLIFQCRRQDGGGITKQSILFTSKIKSLYFYKNRFVRSLAKFE